MRFCKGCGETKPVSQFYTARGKPNGQCKPCTKARVAQWRRDNPERRREIARASQQRIRRPKDYDEMLAAQGGGCAICGSTVPGGRGRFHADHCHATQRRRGLLCHHCNLLLGNAQDDPERLAAAIEYLKSWTPA